jgi:hypothetical protein
MIRHFQSLRSKFMLVAALALGVLALSPILARLALPLWYAHLFLPIVALALALVIFVSFERLLFVSLREGLSRDAALRRRYLLLAGLTHAFISSALIAVFLLAEALGPDWTSDKVWLSTAFWAVGLFALSFLRYRLIKRVRGSMD